MGSAIGEKLDDYRTLVYYRTYVRYRIGHRLSPRRLRVPRPPGPLDRTKKQSGPDGPHLRSAGPPFRWSKPMGSAMADKWKDRQQKRWPSATRTRSRLQPMKPGSKARRCRSGGGAGTTTWTTVSRRGEKQANGGTQTGTAPKEPENVNISACWRIPRGWVRPEISMRTVSSCRARRSTTSIAIASTADGDWRAYGIKSSPL